MRRWHKAHNAKIQKAAGTKVCECGFCNELIPAINKKGKSARYKHGHQGRGKTRTRTTKRTTNQNKKATTVVTTPAAVEKKIKNDEDDDDHNNDGDDDMVNTRSLLYRMGFRWCSWCEAFIRPKEIQRTGGSAFCPRCRRVKMRVHPRQIDRQIIYHYYYHYYYYYDDDGRRRRRRKSRKGDSTAIIVVTIIAAGVLLGLKLYMLWLWPW